MGRNKKGLYKVACSQSRWVSDGMSKAAAERMARTMEVHGFCPHAHSIVHESEADALETTWGSPTTKQLAKIQELCDDMLVPNALVPPRSFGEAVELIYRLGERKARLEKGRA